jgi:hypothetical protein
MTDGPIPEAAWERIRAFVLARKTGQVTLDVKEGHVLSWKLTEYGRVPEEPQPRPPSIK